MNRKIRLLIIIAVCELLVTTVLFVFPKSHIKVGDDDILFDRGVTVTVHKLLGCEFCNDKKWLQASGDKNCWFGLRKTKWSPDFPGIYVFLDDNNPHRDFKDILNYYRKSSDWTIVDDQESDLFMKSWEKALDTGKREKNKGTDFNKGDQKSSVSKKQEESGTVDSKMAKTNRNNVSIEKYKKDILGFLDMYKYMKYGDKSMRFTARRNGGEPNRYCRFCFKLAGSHLLRMEAEWTGRPKVPPLVEKAFGSVTVKVR
ncbi:MAG: hypothetical protein GXO70_10545 [Acidobacteria bacterium]|nr:hypothetical protein [Acidobacteriota bacterium]